MTIIQQSTKDYKRFVMNQMNRTISDGEAGFVPRKDLLESMKRDGFWKVAPVICTEVEGGKLNIVEGHNRFVTARYLGLREVAILRQFCFGTDENRMAFEAAGNSCPEGATAKGLQRQQAVAGYQGNDPIVISRLQGR